MSRSGYIDQIDPLELGRWRGQVKSAMRGRKGQAFLRELAAAMDAMPVKELIAGELIDNEGDCCTIGAVCKARGLDVSGIDYEDPEQIADAVGIARQLVAEIEYENDENGDGYECVAGEWKRKYETPAERWERMRKWVEEAIVPAVA